MQVTIFYYLQIIKKEVISDENFCFIQWCYRNKCFKNEVIICHPNSIVDDISLNLSSGDIIVANSITDFNTVEDFREIINQVTAEYRATFISINNPAVNIIDGKVD